MDTSFRDLWMATATAPPTCPPLAGTQEADVTVIGAGFTGLSAALHLGQAGMSVRVLDAESPDFGCSGRNGGQVNPASTRLRPSEVRAQLGSMRGERFLTFGEQSCDLVFDLMAQYGIDCEAVRPGYLQGGYGGRGKAKNETWAADWRERGVDVELYDRDGMAEVSGTRGGNVQPLSYARGLARAAVGEGAVLDGESKAVAVEPDGAGWRVKTPAGEVRSRHVLLATNGYTDDLWPGLRQSVVPVTSFACATKPLGHNVGAGVLPGRHAVAETARVIVYYRRDAAGRFIIGGRGNFGDVREHGDHSHVREAAVRLFPQLAEAEWEYEWAGWPAMARHYTPYLFRLAAGVHAGLGYNGRGVGSATLMGKQLAHVVLGDAEPLVEVTPLETFKLHAFRQFGISATLASGEMLDRLDR